MKPFSRFLLVPVFSAACSRTPQQPPPLLKISGSVHAVMMGDTAPKVELATEVNTPHSHGLGAISGLRGEVTVSQGETCLSYADGPERIRSVFTREPMENATLLVSTEVQSWTEIQIKTPIAFADLESFIAGQVRKHGWGKEDALPFRIEGHVDSLSWHVVDGSRLKPGQTDHHSHASAAVRGTVHNRSPIMIGFYSTQHRGIFTHRDSSLHIHFMERESNLCGHVDRVEIGAGSVLKLPNRTAKAH